MSEIVDIYARQILDSRGNPTVEVDVTLDDGRSLNNLRCPDEVGPPRPVNGGDSQPTSGGWWKILSPIGGFFRPILFRIKKSTNVPSFNC